MKQPIKILIPNITSARNIGDVAMVEVLMKLILSTYPQAQIRLQSSEPHTHSYTSVTSIKPSLYYWAVFEDRRVFIRVRRLSRLLLLVIGAYFKIPAIIKLASFKSQSLSDLVQDFTEADIIIFVGGGYLRSKKGISQSLNLLMNLLPFGFAHVTRARKIIAPISIGPFGSGWHKWFTAQVIKKFDLVAVRERYSFNAMKPYRINNLIRTSDHALLVKSTRMRKAKSTPVIGFTIRQWLKGDDQAKLENAYATALALVSQSTSSRIQPIIQVDAPKFGEGDGEVTARVVKHLKKLNAAVLPITQIKSVSHAKTVYGQLDLLVGMRMHSNILAAVQGVPFVAVSYEYKTEGIARDLQLGSVCIRCEDVNSANLQKLVKKAFAQRGELAKQMNDALSKIQSRDSLHWQRILQA